MQLSKKADLDVASSSSSVASLLTEPTSLVTSVISIASDFDPHLPYPGCCSECSKTTTDLELLPTAASRVKSDVTVHSGYSRTSTSSLSSGSIISTCSQEASDFSTSLSSTVSHLSPFGSYTEESSTAET